MKCASLQEVHSTQECATATRRESPGDPVRPRKSLPACRPVTARDSTASIECRGIEQLPEFGGWLRQPGSKAKPASG